jgi:hypothetical protein
MGLACSLDIYQEKMSELFINMTFVIVYKDNILVLASGSFVDHDKICTALCTYIQCLSFLSALLITSSYLKKTTYKKIRHWCHLFACCLFSQLNNL